VPSRLLVVAYLATNVACSAHTDAVEYSVNAQINYNRGVDELHRRDWTAASSYFTFITSRFPYSKYAELAELGLADIQFGQGQWLDAMAAYRLFIKSHPFHDLVGNGYVSFRLGEAYGRSHCEH